MSDIRGVQRGTLYTNSRVVLLTPSNGTKFTLEELQLAVGGLIEPVIPLDGRSRLYVNEDGIAKQLSPNPHTFTIMDVARYGYPQSFRIRGNAVSVYSAKNTSDDNRVTVKEALREIHSVSEHLPQNGD